MDVVPNFSARVLKGVEEVHKRNLEHPERVLPVITIDHIMGRIPMPDPRPWLEYKRSLREKEGNNEEISE